MEPEEHCVVTARQRRSELKFRAVGVRQISVKSPLEKQRLTWARAGDQSFQNHGRDSGSEKTKKISKSPAHPSNPSEKSPLSSSLRRRPMSLLSSHRALCRRTIPLQIQPPSHPSPPRL
jgi:hypothetical protein